MWGRGRGLSSYSGSDILDRSDILDILDRSKITRSLTCIQYRVGSEINVFAMGIVW